MPGTTSKGMPASASAAISSAARPKMSGSPLLSRTTLRPARACSIISALISSCVMFFAPQRLPTLTILRWRGQGRGSAGGTRSSCRITSRGLDEAQRLHGEQIGVAGACADEVDLAAPGIARSRIGCCDDIPERWGCVRAVVERASRRIAGAPVRCSRACALRPADAWPELRGAARRVLRARAQSCGKLLVDFAAKPLGNGRAFAGGRDGDLQIAAAHHRTEEEIAVGDVVDAVAQGFRARPLRDRRCAFTSGSSVAAITMKLPSRSAGSKRALDPFELACVAQVAEFPASPRARSRAGASRS